MAAGGQIVVLRAHVFDLCQLQCAVLLGLRECFAGDIGVHMPFERLVVFTDNQAVTDAVKIGAQRGEIHSFALFAHDINGVKGKCDAFGINGFKIRFVLDAGRRLIFISTLGHRLAAQA